MFEKIIHWFRNVFSSPKVSSKQGLHSCYRIRFINLTGREKFGFVAVNSDGKVYQIFNESGQEPSARQSKAGFEIDKHVGFFLPQDLNDLNAEDELMALILRDDPEIDGVE